MVLAQPRRQAPKHLVIGTYGFAKDDADNENQRRTDSSDSYRTAVGNLHLIPSDASSLAGMKIQGGSS
jgi:hypothetical protein